MNGNFRYILGIIYLLLNLSCYSQKDTSNQEQAAYKNGCKLLDSAQYKEAIIQFKKAIKLKTDYNKMAISKLKLDDYKGAEKDLQAALKIASDNFESEKNLSILYYQTKRYKEAKVMMDSAIAQNPDDAELLYYQAKLMFDGKGYKDAFDACSRAVELNPKYIEAMILKGDCKFALKEYAYAVKEYNDAVKLMSAEKPIYEAYKARAKARFETRDYKNAVNDWNVYLEAFPKEEGALISRGACKIETGDNTGAIADLDEAIKLNDKNPVSYNYRGVAKGENKQFVEALKDFDYAIKLKYNYGEAFVNRAAIKFASKDKQGACDDLNKADSLGDEMAIKLIDTYCKH
jgi:tetratricopeptide (TPR) repeat protein